LRIKQLTMLLAAKKSYIDFEEFTLTLQCKTIRAITTQLFFSTVILQVFYYTAILIDSDAVVQLIVSINFYKCSLVCMDKQLTLLYG